MDEKQKNSELYIAAMIEKYLQGNMSADEMHAVEKAALDDPFLADAIEGMSKVVESRGSNSLDMDIAELRQRLKHRITQNKNKVVPIGTSRNWWQVAAVFFILVFSGAMTYYYIHNSLTEKRSIAQENTNTIQPANDSARAQAPAVASKESDSIKFDVATQRKPKANRAIISQKKNNSPVEFRKDSSIMDGVAMERAQPAKKKDEPVLVEKNEDKSVAGKASSAQYFSAPTKQNSFMGKVTDQNNKPIPDAFVKLADKKIGVITDNNGNFKLNIKETDSVVVAEVVSNGYIPQLADLSNDGSTNIIILHDSRSNNLQEVLGFSQNNRYRKNFTRQQTTQDAAPVNGWDEYNRYLEKNKKPPQDSIGLKGPVMVSFVVNKKGKLSNFVIEQSLGPDYDEEAIRLVKKGPPWKLLKGKKANINVIVIF